MPLPGGIFPLRRDIPQRQVNQLRCSFVAEELPLVANRVADLAAQAFNGVRRIEEFAHLEREGEKWNHILPAPAPTGDHRSVALTPGAGLEAIQLGGGLGRRGP